MSCTHKENAVPPLKKVLALTLSYMVIEAVAGYYAGSLALLADAGHMLADSGALVLSLFASWLALQPASSQKTYGYYRVEILAALVNGLTLGLIAYFILSEALTRLWIPQPVMAPTVIWVALGGLLVNLMAVRWLHASQQCNLNVRGAYLHVLGDLLGSIGALVAGGLMWGFGWMWADSVVSIAISILILVSAARLTLEAVNVLLEGCPAHINVQEVKATLLKAPGVVSVHDLHVWTIASGKDALSAHVVVHPEAYTHDTLSALQHTLRHEFGLSHLTLQLEPPEFEEALVHF
jgi:cobalt-zinc-cadmium efflux system protein